MKNRKIYLLLMVGVFLVILPYAYTILYSLPSTDDFWMASLANKQTLFQDSVKAANEFWHGWGGLWLYEFLRVLLNPLILFGTTSRMFGIELLCFYLFFLWTLWIAISAFWKCIIRIEDKNCILGCYLLILVWFLNTEIWTEVFYWFVGTAYMWAISFTLLTVSLELYYFRKSNLRNAIAMTFVGIIACSFYSQAVFPCMIYLVLLVLDFKKKRKTIFNKFIPFAFFVLGALSALIAPGNYVRKGNGTGAIISIFTALKDTLELCMQSLFDLVKNPLSIIMFIVFTACGMLILKKSESGYKYPQIPFVLSAVCLYIAYFPFALGYGGTIYSPNRMKFAFTMFEVLLFAMDFIYLGGWLRYEKNVRIEKKKFLVGCTYLVAFAYVCFIPTNYYQTLPYAQTVAQIRQVKAANEEWLFLLYYIENSDEENVCFERAVVNTPIIKSPGITSDENNSINQHIADYFGKEKISILWK